MARFWRDAAFQRAFRTALIEGRDSIVDIAKLGSLFYVVHEYGVDVTTCIGPSMLPTFNVVGDVVLMERVSTNVFKRYTRGDVVIAQSPTKANQTVCKRIRAVAGDRVIVPSEQGRATGYAGHVIEIPPGHIWLEGDNALNSTDSRYYGPVPSSLIKGRVVFRIWPLPVGLMRCIPPVQEYQELDARFKADPKLQGLRDTQAWLQRRSIVMYDGDSSRPDLDIGQMPPSAPVPRQRVLLNPRPGKPSSSVAAAGVAAAVTERQAPVAHPAASVPSSPTTAVVAVADNERVDNVAQRPKGKAEANPPCTVKVVPTSSPSEMPSLTSSSREPEFKLRQHSSVPKPVEYPSSGGEAREQPTGPQAQGGKGGTGTGEGGERGLQK